MKLEISKLPSFIRYLLQIFIPAILVSIVIIIFNFINFKEFLIHNLGIPANNLGEFFFIEMIIILYTIFLVILFTLDKELNSIVPQSIRNASVFMVAIGFCGMIGLYYFALKNTEKGSIMYLLRDCISYFPIFIFFITNLFFLFFNLKNLAIRKSLLRIILILDVPFVFSYFFVIYFVLNNTEHIKIHDYLAGVSVVALMSSNLVTAAYNTFKNDFKNIH
jgi:hypothetical protein